MVLVAGLGEDFAVLPCPVGHEDLADSVID